MSDFLLYGSFLFFYLLLMYKAGKVYPILYLFFFTYFLQYIFSTFLIYNVYQQLKYQMPIAQNVYFEYCIPAIGSLFLGLILFNRDVDIKSWLKRIDPRQASNLGFFLLIVSYGFDLLPILGVESLGSIISFTAYFKYLAAICFLYTGVKAHFLIIAVIYAHLALNVLSGGVFIDFFVWSTFLFLFICIKYEIPFWLRIGFIVIVVPILVAVQSVKSEYREATWGGKREGGIELFNELSAKKSKENSNDPFARSEGVVRTVGRLTQGWHLGLTMRRVPVKQTWADGDEILSDILSSILPRLFYPEKKEVNSPEKFYKYTGHRIIGETSMSIGILGDFYINFHRWGSYIMLFLFGAFISRFLYFFLRKYVYANPLNIIWIPFMLSYLIRANNDFYIVFNCMLKGFLIFLFINYITNRLWAPAQVVSPTPQQQPR
jgi:hypothetical protein